MSDKKLPPPHFKPEWLKRVNFMTPEGTPYCINCSQTLPDVQRRNILVKMKKIHEDAKQV